MTDRRQFSADGAARGFSCDLGTDPPRRRGEDFTHAADEAVIVLDVEDFRGAVLSFLNFAPRHAALAGRLADAVARHATPVGSGTVARTQRIPIERRAESAVIAWLRHATTAYDNMKIPRVKGRRREVRRLLAEESRRLLEKYRAGQPADPASCPLQLAMAESGRSAHGE